MCKDHSKVSGKKAVALFAESRILENTCAARHAYLLKQAISFHAWLETQGCDDPTAVCANVVKDVERTLKEQGPNCLTNRPDDELSDGMFECGAENNAKKVEDEDTGKVYLDYLNRMDHEEEAHDDEADEMDRIAMFSMGKVEAKLFWYNSKLHALNEELELHDKIADALDIIPSLENITNKQRNNWRNYRIKCFSRIDELRRAKKLSYDGWFIFNNVLLETLGQEPKAYQYGEMKDISNKISFYEARKEEARNAIETDKPLVKESKLEDESYLLLQAEIWS